MIQAVILAAGKGQRMQPLTLDRPKALVSFLGKTLLDRNLKLLKGLNINDVRIVGGHGADNFSKDLRLYLNSSFTSTNMAYSLFETKCIDPSKDLLVLYGDCIYHQSNIEAVINASFPVALGVDLNWLKLWSLRFHNPLDDCETLKLEGNFIIDIGQKPKSLATIDGQYMGLFKIKKDILASFIEWYFSLKKRLDLPNTYNNFFLTDVFQLYIKERNKIEAVLCHGGWLEFDSLEDIKLYESLYHQDILKDFYDENR